MNNIPLDEGTDLIAQLFEALKIARKDIYDHSLKITAMENSLQLFPEARRAYDEALERVTTPEVARLHDMSMQGFDHVIARLRTRQNPVN